MKKYYAKKIGDAIKKIISPLITDPIIANIVKGWSSFVPEWALCLTPSHYANQTKTLWLNANKDANLLYLQYQSAHLKDLVNVYLGYTAILNVKIKHVKER
ncbi:DciA family protein [Candidatus Cytomitobacter primus]|uniref:DciA family protein n=1 Tax=Candidatus Cytomitobacter primus TaxID=2066024 RepID=UPI0016535751|nr:DciA family protein [Candidatus Cytomitobacter primus]